MSQARDTITRLWAALDNCLRDGRGPMIARSSLAELKRAPTLCVGQADNLKLDDGEYRVWLSRCTVDDGEPYDNKVTVERLKNGRWVTVDEYQAH